MKKTDIEKKTAEINGKEKNGNRNIVFPAFKKDDEGAEAAGRKAIPDFNAEDADTSTEMPDFPPLPNNSDGHIGSTQEPEEDEFSLPDFFGMYGDVPADDHSSDGNDGLEDEIGQISQPADDAAQESDQPYDPAEDQPAEDELSSVDQETADQQNADIEQGPAYEEEQVDAEPAVAEEAPKETVVKKASGKKSVKKKKKKTRRIIKNVLRALLLLILIGCIGIGLYIQYNLRGVPELDLSKAGSYSEASQIYDTNGNFLMEYGSNENITWVSIDDVPDHLKDAFVSIEDKRFYEHNGIDIRRLVGAIWGQLTGTANYGASTITQQLVKNTYLSQEVTYKRKIQEIYLALQLEKIMSKDEILEWYVNTVFMGSSNYGIVNAAKDYFGKDLSQLSLRECACLAGLVQSPNYYNPRTNYNTGNMSPTDTRTDTVLYAMYENGKITKEEYEAALSDKLVLSETGRQSVTSANYYANAYFVDYAMTQIATKVLQSEGTEVTDTAVADKKTEFRNGGYKFYLTIDTDIQNKTQTAASEFTNYPVTGTESTAQFSAVVMDQHNGQIKAIVGGRDQATEAEGFNRATDSTQAVGSSIKPLSVYAPAIEHGDYPGTVVDDMPYAIVGYGVNNSWPSGDYIDGPITMRKALEMSHNIPASRFLLERVGIDNSYNYMIKEGFNKDNLQLTASGLALGATDVTTLEMTGAYATLANGGVYIEPHTYTAVYNRAGDLVLDDSNIETHRVFSEETAWLVTDMMQTNMTEGLGVNARLSSVDSCGKTGTHEKKVISFGGYTGYYTSFMRVSTDDYVNFTNSSSYYQAARLWRNYMQPIHEGLANKNLQEKTQKDLDIVQVYVCSKTGLLASQACQDAGTAYTEYATSKSAPTTYCEDSHVGEGSIYGYIDPNTGLWVDGGWWSEDGTFHPFE